MSSPPPETARPVSRYPLLKWATGVVLLLVLLALGWMMAAAWWPEWADWVGLWVALPVQVGLILGLLVAALVLVSLAALLHTRS